ncbi:short-chain dehydrogenase reductase acting with nad or nadp as acceptor [Plasmopara halstedii]|uniref:Short-chain dehydrogenase reductase acting with nad or nadp as acceptor n=1 Tax=Plasmopara halstedii TaxID=4781 RepID=A0A0P1B0P1_PLAHL|nr:short-chain dehydrogenase reductase acting with nad or nadp as acceptor [Plasmopara halstedii]CEG47231.1 short-chain dehydrogenase reductase acting with nad or nadp as acceptor [Plasmopara halstedii]|eukprot:XP_024583600.1 short-chain dehydrogenase reductase acting with nad or nadp as acceptor [Plasmopara halstedii]
MLKLLAHMQATLKAAPLSVSALAAVGCLVLSRLVLQLLVSFYAFFLRPAKSLKSFGQWGVVTGATDGIGKALAMELARKEMNLVLLSRTQSRLETVRNEILAKYPTVQVKTLAVDFDRVDEPKVREIIQKKLDEIRDVGVLFNNVGVSYDFPEFFDQLSEERMDSLIKLNVTSGTIMTKLVLPGMVQRKRGVIVNLSSGSGRMVVPLLSEYSATKKYIEQLTLCLAAEYAAKNLLGTLSHHIWLYESVPSWLLAKVAMITHLSLRKRALKKLEGKKKE